MKQTLRVQVSNNHILTQNQYYNYYYPKPKYLTIGYLDPLGNAMLTRTAVLLTVKPLLWTRRVPPGSAGGKSFGNSFPQTWVVPKIRGTFLGVPKMRIMVFWGLHWVPLTLKNYHLSSKPEAARVHLSCILSPSCFVQKQLPMLLQDFRRFRV